MKKIILLISLLLLLPAVFAININLEKSSAKVVMISELDSPATYELKITNNGETDDFRIYNLLGFQMQPEDLIEIKSNETKDVSLIIYPRADVEVKNTYPLEFRIRASDDTEIIETAYIRFVDLKDAISISADPVNPDSEQVTVYIQNKENFDFEKIKLVLSSSFFELNEETSLKPFEKRSFTLSLDKEKSNSLNAGFYTISGEVEVDGQKSEVEGIIGFSAKEDLETTESSTGFFVISKTIEKINNGNVAKTVNIVINKNIISRLFTSFNQEPDSVEREGWITIYTWNGNVNPGETFTITAKTNWLLPFFILILILAIVILAVKYKDTDILMKKKVSFVKTKGGEFALRVAIYLHSKKYIENINITDRFPAMVQVYEKFGTQIPAKIDESRRTIRWNFEKLEKGETRVLNYIIYSKVGVLGKFALPPATAIYERDGELQDSQSNRAYFISETRDDLQENN